MTMTTTRDIYIRQGAPEVMRGASRSAASGLPLGRAALAVQRCLICPPRPMKHPDIDNDDSLFHFDPYEYSPATDSADPPSMSPQSLHAAAIHPVLDEPHSTDSGKGKSVVQVQPLSISTSLDPFDSPSIARFIIPSDNVVASPASSQQGLDSSPSSTNQPLFDLTPPNGAPPVTSLAAKGKGRDVPPSLPPLSFSPTEFRYSPLDWPCGEQSPSSPGPSSYGSGHTSLLTASSRQSHPSPVQAHETCSRKSSRPPSLRRSQSNFSMRSARSSAAQSMTKIKQKLGSSSKAPVKFARKLLSRNKVSDAQDASFTGATNSPNQSTDELPGEDESYPFPCHAVDGALKPPMTSALAELDDIAAFLAETPTWDPSATPLESVPILKGKGRSYSSPFPKSAFDFVPQLEPNAFMPLSLPHTRNIFDEILPRELKLHIFSTLIKLHEEEYEQLKHNKKWSFLKASSSKNRWVGRNRAMRELVRFSRVSATISFHHNENRTLVRCQRCGVRSSSMVNCGRMWICGRFQSCLPFSYCNLLRISVHSSRVSISLGMPASSRARLSPSPAVFACGRHPLSSLRILS